MGDEEKFKLEKTYMEKLGSEDNAALMKLMMDAKRDLISFRTKLLEIDVEKEYEPAPFHREWSDILLHGKESVAIQAFRESAKSQIVMRSFPLYCLTFPEKGRQYIIFILANNKLAGKKLKEIEREYRENKQLCGNLVKVVEESGDAFEVVVQGLDSETLEVKYISIRIEAYGKGGAIRGASWGARRPDIVVIDDIQDFEDTQSDTVLEQNWNWFMDDIKFLGNQTRFFMIGNNLGEKCIIERIHRGIGDFNFKKIKVPVASGTMPDSVPTWPSKNKMSDILKERDQYQREGKLSIWTRNKMCECVAEEDKVFTRSMFRYYDLHDTYRLAESCNLYLRIDPSAAVKESADYSAFEIAGINKENHLIFFDIRYGRFKQSEKVDIIFELVAKWNKYNFINCGIENAKEGIILMQDVIDQMARRNIFFQCIEIPHENKQKEARIESLQPMFNCGAVWFPRESDWLPELEQEFLMFTRDGRMSMHDDLIDCASMFKKKTQAPVNTPFNFMSGDITIDKRQLVKPLITVL